MEGPNERTYSDTRRSVTGYLNKKAQAGVAALGVLLLTALPVSVAAAPSNIVPPDVNASVLAGPTVGPVVTTGRLQAADGSGVSGTVAALAWPTPDNLAAIPKGGSFVAPTVGWAKTDANGAFNLRVDSAQLTSRYRAANGTVNIEVIGWAGGNEGITFEPVSLVQLSSQAAAVNAVSSNVTVTLSRAVNVAHPSRSLAGSRAPGAPGITCINEKVGNPVYPWAIVGTSFPFPYDYNYAYLDVSNTYSQSYSVGVAISGNGSTWAASGTSSYSSSFGFNWGVDSVSYLRESHDYELTTKYQKWYDTCGGYTEENEGSAGGAQATNPGWQGFSYNCQPSGPGLWIRSNQGGYTFSVGGGVLIKGVIGINLSMNTAYDSSRTLNYRILDNTSMCGSNDAPALAAQVSEE